MVTTFNRKRMAYIGLTLALGLFFVAPAAFAAAGTEGAEEATSVGSGLRALGLAIGAGAAIGIAGLGTGRAQAAVGAAGAGALAEKPELFGRILVLFAIPETIVILGFVIAILLFNSIG
jgi:V/A-type H+-transporting ATPase subunit K